MGAFLSVFWYKSSRLCCILQERLQRRNSLRASVRALMVPLRNGVGNSPDVENAKNSTTYNVCSMAARPDRKVRTPSSYKLIPIEIARELTKAKALKIIGTEGLGFRSQTPSPEQWTFRLSMRARNRLQGDFEGLSSGVEYDPKRQSTRRQRHNGRLSLPYISQVLSSVQPTPPHRKPHSPYLLSFI